jgi:hypothetical protein
LSGDPSSAKIGDSIATGESVPNRDVYDTMPSGVESVTSIVRRREIAERRRPDCAGVTNDVVDDSAPVASPLRTMIDVFETPITSPAPSRSMSVTRRSSAWNVTGADGSASWPPGA